jgi:arylsulfatase A-like enzyme
VILYVQDNGNTKAIRGRRASMKMVNNQPSPTKWRREEPKGRDEFHLGEDFPYKTRDGLVYRWGEDVMPGPDGTYILLGKEWANVSNMPFRRYKGETHEGGITTPLIFSWPEGVKKPGAIVNDLSHIIDMMPTCVELADASYPKELDGKKIFPCQGKSLVPVVCSNGTTGDRTLCFEHRGNCSVRDKNWKLAMLRDNIWQDKWELYDMNVDRAETNDLAGKYPEKVKEYKAKWMAWAHENHVLPHKFLGTDAKGTDASNPLLPKKGKKSKTNKK